MAIERVNLSFVVQKELRNFVFELIRDGYHMEDILTALAGLKVEMASAMVWQDVINTKDVI
jgi:hypothetical protein